MGNSCSNIGDLHCRDDHDHDHDDHDGDLGAAASGRPTSNGIDRPGPRCERRQPLASTGLSGIAAVR
jgi:hypothetical protein